MVTPLAPRWRRPAPTVTSARGALRPSMPSSVWSWALRSMTPRSIQRTGGEPFSLPRNIESDRFGPDAGKLSFLLAHVFAEQAGPPETGLVRIDGRAAQLDQHFILVDHEGEFEADAVAAGPGDARRHAGRAPDEQYFAADRRNGAAF